MAEQSFFGLSRPSRGLVDAISRLEEALDRDPREFAQKVQAFTIRFHDYSPLNRFLIFLQKENATFVKGRNQWAMEGRQVSEGVEAIRILAPVFSTGIVKSLIRFKEVMVRYNRTSAGCADADARTRTGRSRQKASEKT